MLATISEQDLPLPRTTFHCGRQMLERHKRKRCQPERLTGELTRAGPNSDLEPGHRSDVEAELHDST